LVYDLIKIGLWNEGIKNKLIMENGSVQNIPEIPTEMKEVYKTVWEMSQKRILQMAANRSVFIDQSQSLNLFVDNATKPKLLAAHLFGWKLGLKTGMYYLRTRAAVDAIKGLGVDMSTSKPIEQTSSVNNVEVPKNNFLISEQTPEVVMTLDKPVDSPFDCEGCGS
jgi:ribonucleoside-diphosphate reductase alpha chain